MVNGQGSIAVMNIGKCNKSISDSEYIEYIENALDEADIEAENPETKYLTHEEIFSKLKNHLVNLK